MEDIKMMTLVEAKELVTPILVSELLKTNRALQEKVLEIRKMFEFEDFDFSKNQTILDTEKEKAFRELVAMYNGVDIYA